MSEQRHVDVRFRGEIHRISVDLAHMLALRGHLIRRQFSDVMYEVEDDRYIEVTREVAP